MEMPESLKLRYGYPDGTELEVIEQRVTGDGTRLATTYKIVPPPTIYTNTEVQAYLDGMTRVDPGIVQNAREVLYGFRRETEQARKAMANGKG